MVVRVQPVREPGRGQDRQPQLRCQGLGRQVHLLRERGGCPSTSPRRDLLPLHCVRGGDRRVQDGNTMVKNGLGFTFPEVLGILSIINSILVMKINMDD